MSKPQLPKSETTAFIETHEIYYKNYLEYVPTSKNSFKIENILRLGDNIFNQIINSLFTKYFDYAQYIYNYDIYTIFKTYSRTFPNLVSENSKTIYRLTFQVELIYSPHRLSKKNRYS